MNKCFCATVAGISLRFEADFPLEVPAEFCPFPFSGGEVQEVFSISPIRHGLAVTSSNSIRKYQSGRFASGLVKRLSPNPAASELGLKGIREQIPPGSPAVQITLKSRNGIRHQMNSGSPSVRRRCATARFHQPSPSARRARKYPDTIKKNGTAMLPKIWRTMK